MRLCFFLVVVAVAVVLASAANNSTLVKRIGCEEPCPGGPCGAQLVLSQPYCLAAVGGSLRILCDNDRPNFVRFTSHRDTSCTGPAVLNQTRTVICLDFTSRILCDSGSSSTSSSSDHVFVLVLLLSVVLGIF